MKENIKFDEEMRDKYNISDKDMFNIFFFWKDEFTVAIDELEKKIQKELLEEYFKLSEKNRNNFMVARALNNGVKIH